jgi:hypothetical protein
LAFDCEGVGAGSAFSRHLQHLAAGLGVLVGRPIQWHEARSHHHDPR